MRAAALVLALVVLAVAHDVNPLAKMNVRAVTRRAAEFITIDVTPNTLETNNDPVVISYAGVPHPSADDFIAAYTPGDANIALTAPSKYIYANLSEGYMSTGAGSVTLNLVNSRRDYRFVFFRGGLIQPIAVAFTANTVNFTNPNEPLQGHLSLTTEQDQMMVVWSTRDVGTPTVQWGTSPGVYQWSATPSTTTYTQADLCGPPATTVGWLEPGVFHYGVMGPLTPNTRYYYVYGDPVFGMAEEASFVSAPAVGPDSSFSFFAYGDMGQASLDGAFMGGLMQELPSINTTNLMMNDMEGRSLAVHIGDISYARGYVTQWDNFFAQIYPIASQIPYMTCIGNHERDYPNSHALFQSTDSGGECGVAYYQRLPLPGTGVDQPWYSFNYGNVHFTFMSTEHNFTVGSPQWEFLAADLAAVDRSVTPWVVFSGHRPMYIDSTNNATSTGDTTVAAVLVANVEPLLVKYGVDMAFWGHHHSFQLTCPVINGVCQPAGTAPVHMVIGMAGQGESTNIWEIPPVWIEYVNIAQHGYLRVNVTSSEFAWQFVGDIDGSIVHTGSLYKNE